MKVYWVESEDQRKAFTSKLLKWWCTRRGLRIVSRPDEADLMLASCCSPRDLPIVIKARRISEAAGKPLLLGGTEMFTGATYLAYADYVCVGEGYSALAYLAGAGCVDCLGALPQILSRDDPHKHVVPDYHVPWNLLPAIQVAPNTRYYLAGRGCHNKCKFCATSWVQPHQTINPRLLEETTAAVVRQSKTAHILYVTNDEALGIGAGSTTVKRFLSLSPPRWPRLVRLGIEGVTEERRRWFAKPISDIDIAAAMNKAATVKSDLELFWIIGFDDDPAPAEAYAGLYTSMAVDTIRQPKVVFKYTWFIPYPHTPLGRWDLQKLAYWPYMDALNILQGKSTRIRRISAGPLGKSLWEGVFRRLEPEHAERWYKYRTSCDKASSNQVLEWAYSVAGAGVVDGTGSFPWDRVKTRISMG